MRALLVLLLAALPARGQESGRDGPLLVSGRVVTERGGVVITDAPAGAAEVSVQALRVGPQDLVLFSRASGAPAEDQGAWFTARVHDLRGSILTLAEPLPHAARAGTQVVRVLEPSTVMVADGGQLVAPAFDGVTGGILAVFTPGDFWNDGLVSATGAGFPGGLPRTASRSGGCPDGGAAEAGAGPGSGGAGGPCPQGGGGGGGGIGRGGTGGASRDGARQGGAGGAGCQGVLESLCLGGGGGAGWSDATDPGIISTSRAGAGGGLVLVRAGKVLGAGSFEANGAAAPGFGGTDYGLGGGGAGGSIVIASRTSVSCGVVRANGGAGGGGNNFFGGGGGGGGGGFVWLGASRGASCAAEALAGLGGSFRGGQAEPTSRAASPFAGVVLTEPAPGGWRDPEFLRPGPADEVEGLFQVHGTAPGVEAVRLILNRLGVLDVPVVGDEFKASLPAPAAPGSFVLEAAGLVAGVEVVRSRPLFLRAGQSVFSIQSTPNERADCATPWRYDDDNQPEVTTGEAVRWAWAPLPDLPAPTRLVVDDETGAVTWTPRASDVGRVGFELIAANGRGRARQRVEVLVDCTLAVGCQVSGQVSPLWLALSVLLLRRRRPVSPR